MAKKDSKQGDSEASSTSESKKRKLTDAVSQEEFDAAYNPPPEGLTQEEAMTVLQDVIPEDTGASLEGYHPEEFEGDPDALRESLERLREEGSVDAASDALERLDELEGLDSPEGDSEAVETDGEPIHLQQLAEKMGLSLDDVLVPRKVQGEEETIPLSQALNEHMMQEDYSRKTAALSKEREEKIGELDSRLAQEALGLEVINGVLGQALTPQQREQVGQALQRKQAERAALQAYRLENEILPREHAALRSELGWETEEDVREGKERLAEAAVSMGFDGDDLSNVHDHRLLVMLDKAARYDEMQARTEEAKQEVRGKRRPKSKTLKPGVQGAQKKRGRSKLSEAQARLSRSGSVEDAAAVLDDILPDDI